MINAYNAFTISLILEKSPKESIKEITKGFFSFGPWKIQFIPLLGEKISLDTIEHEYISPVFKEPRIQFVKNCASISCPSLLPEAITADKIEGELEMDTNNFLANPDKNYLKNDTLYLSKIFDWYAEDFESFGGVQNFVISRLKLKKEKYKIKFLDYNWKLNSLINKEN